MTQGNPQISPLMEELSVYIAGARKRRLPEAVIECAKIHLVDTYAAMISGTQLLPGRRALAYVKSLGGKPQASVVGTRIVTSIPNAGFANAMLAHADETDDTHPITGTHPGSGSVPAILAIGERDRLAGSELLRAMVLGYDIGARLILTVTELHFRHTGHRPSIFARVFSAAAAAGALLRLDQRRIRYMLSYAAQQASGMATMLRDTEHIEKAFCSGMPVHNGIVAALVAEQGFTGVEDVFAGKHNFFSTYAPAADLSILTRGLGQDYEIMRASIKRWSIGGPIQAAMHLLYDLVREHKLKADEVERIVVRMPEIHLQTVSNRHMADISLEHLLAVMLVDGTLTFKSTHDYARMKDARVLAARRKVAAMSDGDPATKARGWRAAMEIVLKNGRSLYRKTDAAKGSYENPLTRGEEHEKALDLIGPVMGKQRAGRLLAALWDFESVKDVRSLRRLASAR